jgi:hypothetical protein
VSEQPSDRNEHYGGRVRRTLLLILVAGTVACQSIVSQSCEDHRDDSTIGRIF